MKHIHILGICGTFMGSLALLAKARGFNVSGSDENVYPPMSTQLESAGISLASGYTPDHLKPAPDLVIVGNAMSRGNAAVEYLLNARLPYTSGPQFLAEHILQDKWVLAVAGTHGKTTTASMLTWILEYANMQPGFLIGGVPNNFKQSAHLGNSPFFVIEADEYDTAFFDKRSKFIHYRPQTLLLNNLEFDHADIFDDIASIQKQFHHLVKTIPSEGKIIASNQSQALGDMLTMGCWTPIEWFGHDANWQLKTLKPDGSAFNILHNGTVSGTVKWAHTGQHNMENALGALLAARHAGVSIKRACEALSCFKGVKRRMELLADINDIRIYDDFAHHPTAIKQTLSGWRAHTGKDTRIRVVIEPRSNTMKQGVHQQALIDATNDADEVIWFEPAGLQWSLHDTAAQAKIPSRVFNSTQDIIQFLAQTVEPGDDIVIMSNGGFNGIHKKLINTIETRAKISA